METLFQRRRFGADCSFAPQSRVPDQSGITESDAESVFANWEHEVCSLALWHRDVGIRIKAAFDALDLDRVRGFRITTSADDARENVGDAVTAMGFGTAELTKFLTADITLLARHFVAATGSLQLDMRLEVVRDDACRRFHVDNMPARLVVTYVGPGTVFVPRSQAKRALEKQRAYAGPVVAMTRFAAGLFAGTAAGRPGLVHRSPRLGGTNGKRLFFAVNRAAQ